MKTSRKVRTAVALMVVAPLAAVASSASLTEPAAAFIAAHCYATGGGDLEVCHAPNQQGQFFATPADEVAYNVQQLQIGSRIIDVFHSESLKSHDPNCHAANPEFNWCATGDSIKVASGTNADQMPASRKFVLWGQYTHYTPDTYNYYGPPDGVGGAANPMTVAGLPGDPYYYTYYLDTHTDDLQSTPNASLYRNQLLLARTKDFSTWQVLAQTPSGEQWETEASTVNPVPIRDSAGNLIQSNNAMNSVQGLIGSISYVNGIYYYFYTDYVPGTTTDTGADFQLYYRTATNISHDGAWSPPHAVFASQIPLTLVRVAKVAGMNRWAVLYNCYREDAPGDQGLCLQYTQNLEVIAPGGISSLTLFDQVRGNSGLSEDYLGLSSGATDYGEPDWLTDKYGNLPSPRPHITWTNFANTVYGAPLYWADVSIYDGHQATFSQPGDSAVMTGEANNFPHLQTACTPPESDPTCWRFDVYVTKPLSTNGMLETQFWDQSWNDGSALDVYQITAYDSTGRQLGQATHVGNQCNIVGGETGGAEIISNSQCPSGVTSLDIPLATTPDGHVVLVVMEEQAWNTSDFRLDMEVEPAAGAIAPYTPTLSASGQQGQVALQWSVPYDGGSPITGYELYRGTNPDAEAPYRSLSATTASYVDTAVDPGTAYYYEVAAGNANGLGAASNEASAVPTAPPGTPSLTASGVRGGISLTWTPASPNGSPIAGYDLYRGTSPGTDVLYETLPAQTDYTDSSVAAGTTYYYAVAAVNGDGAGHRSNQASARPR